MKKVLSLVFRVAAAVILLQTLFFKFTGAPESVELFTKLGVEPWGRIGTGVIELFTGILLLIPSTAFLGSFIGLGVMSGAIASHLLVLGIASAGDGGTLFALAIVVFVTCLITAILNIDQGKALLSKITGRKSQ
jgi:uncharacterized membrane protein YphA (DoxX/SURF4 family)